ncbi:MAG: hypothetical protein JXB49_33140 [Bacteroidales bacterium]|nr:hypothetical protein [Bacteroidales bacterium]
MIKKQYICLCLIILSGFFTVTGAQVNKEVLDEHELNLKLNGFDKSRIDDADVKLTEAANLFDKAYNTYDTLNKSTWPDANKTLKEAVKIYDEAITTKYEIYDKYTQKFLKGLSGYYYDELDRAKYYENKANNYFRLARLNKKLVDLSKGFYEEFHEYNAAYHNEMYAILNMGRALRIYQDWPVQYDYEWDDYVRPAEKENPSYNLTEIDEKNDTVKVTIYDTVLVIIADTLRMNDPRISFRVQIAAHRKPLSRQYLRTLYKGNEKIFMIQEEGWYKYSIGSYFTKLDEAQQVLNACNVKDAFITCYQYGQKLDFKEAVRRYNLQR